MNINQDEQAVFSGRVAKHISEYFPNHCGNYTDAKARMDGVLIAKLLEQDGALLPKVHIKRQDSQRVNIACSAHGYKTVKGSYTFNATRVTMLLVA